MGFTSLADVKTALTITQSGDDTNIDALRPQVDDLILQLMLRPKFFENGSDVKEYPWVREKTAAILLDRYPNGVITTIHESEDIPRVYDATTLLAAGTDYLLDADRGIVYKMAGTWATAEQAVQVDYDGGYVDLAPPDSLVRAAQMIIAAMLQKGKDRIYHATGTELGDGKLQGVRLEDVPDTAMTMILGYRDERL